MKIQDGSNSDNSNCDLAGLLTRDDPHISMLIKGRNSSILQEVFKEPVGVSTNFIRKNQVVAPPQDQAAKRQTLTVKKVNMTMLPVHKSAAFSKNGS